MVRRKLREVRDRKYVQSWRSGNEVEALVDRMDSVSCAREAVNFIYCKFS